MHMKNLSYSITTQKPLLRKEAGVNILKFQIL